MLTPHVHPARSPIYLAVVARWSGWIPAPRDYRDRLMTDPVGLIWFRLSIP